jgi:hypothetical protein
MYAPILNLVAVLNARHPIMEKSGLIYMIGMGLL